MAQAAKDFRNVYIARLPIHNYGDAELYELVSPFGTIISARIMRAKGSGLSKGYAFVLYDTEDSAQRCIDALSGLKLDAAHTLEVRFAHQNASNPYRMSTVAIEEDKVHVAPVPHPSTAVRTPTQQLQAPPQGAVLSPPTLNASGTSLSGSLSSHRAPESAAVSLTSGGLSLAGLSSSGGSANTMMMQLAGNSGTGNVASANGSGSGTGGQQVIILQSIQAPSAPQPAALQLPQGTFLLPQQQTGGLPVGSPVSVAPQVLQISPGLTLPGNSGAQTPTLPQPPASFMAPRPQQAVLPTPTVGTAGAPRAAADNSGVLFMLPSS